MYLFKQLSFPTLVSKGSCNKEVLSSALAEWFLLNLLIQKESKPLMSDSSASGASSRRFEPNFSDSGLELVDWSKDTDSVGSSVDSSDCDVAQVNAISDMMKDMESTARYQRDGIVADVNVNDFGVEKSKKFKLKKESVMTLLNQLN